MAQIKETKDARLALDGGFDADDRRDEDRRKASAKGFAYISPVGWICRREKIRRKDDPFTFFDECE